MNENHVKQLHVLADALKDFLNEPTQDNRAELYEWLLEYQKTHPKEVAHVVTKIQLAVSPKITSTIISV